MANYIHQQTPFVVPTDDGKTIKEHFGLASQGDGALSIAHMVAPPGWSEPPQKPEFDEYTIMVSGRKQVIIDDETVELNAGETLLIRGGTLVQYANPYKEPAVYWSLCLPAFSMETVHRQEGSANGR